MDRAEDEQPDSTIGLEEGNKEDREEKEEKKEAVSEELKGETGSKLQLEHMHDASKKCMCGGRAWRCRRDKGPQCWSLKRLADTFCKEGIVLHHGLQVVQTCTEKGNRRG